MPSSRKARKAICSLLPVTQGKIYELGSGWGHLIFPIANRFPHLQIRAIEGSPIPWLVSKGLQKILRYPHLTIERKNFLHLDLGQADGIVCYLFPGGMERLKEKFQNELKPGAFVISHTFAIPGWRAEKVIQAEDLWHSPIYLYIKRV